MTELSGAILFGVIDNAVLLAGALFGLELERLLPGRFRAGLGAVVGAGLGNALSDFLAGLPISLEFGAGTGAGCLLALAALPILSRLRRKPEPEA